MVDTIDLTPAGSRGNRTVRYVLVGYAGLAPPRRMRIVRLHLRSTARLGASLAAASLVAALGACGKKPAGPPPMMMTS